MSSLNNAQVKIPRILFVDDEQRILKGLERMLKPLSKNYAIDFASSADEALEKIKNNPIDIICSDMKMPNKDGADLLKEIQALAPSTIRLILSGQAEENHILKALPFVHQYLPKPCEANSLKSVIENISSLSTKLPNAKIRESILSLSTIPSDTSVLNEFISMLNADRVNICDLSLIAKLDIGISTKILHLISSGFLRSKTYTSSIEESIKIIGIDILKRLVNEFPVFKSADNETSKKIIQNANELGILIGLSLEEYAKASNCEKVSELYYLRGLSLLSGRAVLGSIYPYIYQVFMQDPEYSKGNLLGFEKNAFGISSLTLSATIMYLWGITSIFESCGEKCLMHPSLIDMIEKREKQLFGL